MSQTPAAFDRKVDRLMWVFQCQMCARYFGDSKCQAFPGGIPDEVIRGPLDHTEPVAGDGGLRFRPLNELLLAVNEEREADAG